MKMDDVERNNTWELVGLPHSHRPIGLRWVFKLTKNEAGIEINHTTRLITTMGIEVLRLKKAIYGLRQAPRASMQL